MIDHYTVCMKETTTLKFADDTRKDSIYNNNGEFVQVLQYDITDWRQLNLSKVVWKYLFPILQIVWIDTIGITLTPSTENKDINLLVEKY